MGGAKASAESGNQKRKGWGLAFKTSTMFEILNVQQDQLLTLNYT